MIYRTLMTKHRWRDFMYFTQFTIDPVTGEPIEDLSQVLQRYIDILSIYKSSESQPIQFAPALINPSRFNRPAILPSRTPDKIFSIWPRNSAGPWYLWSRYATDKDFELTDTVPFYKDLLVLGTAQFLAVKSGINDELTKSLTDQFESTLSIYVMQEVKPVYQTNQSQGAIPTEWYSYDN
jgi:hypothetical protein